MKKHRLEQIAENGVGADGAEVGTGAMGKATLAWMARRGAQAPEAMMMISAKTFPWFVSIPTAVVPSIKILEASTPLRMNSIEARSAGATTLNA